MFTKTILFIFNALLLGLQAKNNGTFRKFPKDFLFGAATASYQIEGGWNASDKGENIWDRFTHTTRYVKSGSNGDVACDSYNKFNRDVQMLKELGVDYYRFSLSWSRIIPTGFDNEISADGIAYYNNLINLLSLNNISAVVTLYHWDLPQRLQDIGGWANPLMEKYFAAYARLAFETFGDRVTEWLTFNEPVEVCKHGYGGKSSAPGVDLPGVFDYLCGHTLLKAHARVYHLYNDKFRSTQKGVIGLSLSGNWFEPEDCLLPSDVEASNTALQFFLGWFAHPIFSKEGDYPAVMKEKIANMSRQQGSSSSRLPVFTPEEVHYIKGSYDFFGLNHYTTFISRSLETNEVYHKASFSADMGVDLYQRSDWPTSASSWLKVVPWGLEKSLLWIKKEYNNPSIIIFENGFSDKGGTKDDDRINYYRLYLGALLDAIDKGVSVLGYTAWSLMDNFEWSSGYTEKFGLYEVDFNNFARTRTPKASAKFLSNVFKTKTLPSNYTCLNN